MRVLRCVVVLSLALIASCMGDPARESRRHLDDESSFAGRLVLAALERTRQVVQYDPAYVSIAYPGGDVPEGTGVCTDVVIRSYRVLGVDLQKLVHEDMKRSFQSYPGNWGLTRPDPNIDHRRVPNLRTFFRRQGASLEISKDPDDFRPGDLITCTVAGRLPHIAIVAPAPDGGSTPWIVHNIGAGPKLEDRLFEFPMTGHYRFKGD